MSEKRNRPPVVPAARLEWEGYACGDETNEDIAWMVRKDGDILFPNTTMSRSRDGKLCGRRVVVVVSVHNR